MSGLGPTVVRHDASLAHVHEIKDGEMPNDGTMGELPKDLVPDESGMSVAGDGRMPTIHYRSDLEEFQLPSVNALFVALQDPRIGNDWCLCPTPLGNLALLRMDDSRLHDLWYAGYIDLATGEVVLYGGEPELLAQLARNYPFRGAMRKLDGLSHQATLRSLRDEVAR